MKKTFLALQINIAALTLIGCQDPDERLAEFAADATARQAEQNRDTSQLNREVADNHRRVLEATAKSREEIAALEREIGNQRVRLDDERRDLASERRRESILAPAVAQLGVFLVTALPLVLCWYLLYGLRDCRNADDVGEILVEELLANRERICSVDQQDGTIEHATPRVPKDPPPF